MKCSNSALNAQGSTVIIVLVQVEQWKHMKQHWWCSGKRKECTKLNLPPKLVENVLSVPVISFCKISIWGPLYVEICRSQTVKLCIVYHDISSGWQLRRFSKFFLVFRTCLFWFSYLTPMREIYINVVKSAFLEVGSRHSHFRKRGILTVNIQRWKHKFYPYFAFGQTFLLLLIQKTRTG
jgi:hypothetical protein